MGGKIIAYSVYIGEETHKPEGKTMHKSNSKMTTAQADVSEADSQDSVLGHGSRIAPAVALLMMGESALAGTAPPDQDDVISVPEPSALSLLAVGAVVVGTARYIKNKRRK